MDGQDSENIKYVNPSKKKARSRRCAYEEANWLCRYTYYFVWPLLQKVRCSGEKLTSDDFNGHAPEDCLFHNHDQSFEDNWKRELARGKRRASILRAVVKTMGRQVLILWMINILGDAISDAGFVYYCSQFIASINAYIDQRNAMPTGASSANLEADERLAKARQELIGNGLGFIVTSCVTALLQNPYGWGMSRLSLRLRASLSRLIYAKSLRIVKSSKVSYKQAMSLLSRDIAMLELNLFRSAWVFSGVVHFVLSSLILFSSVGWSTMLVTMILSLMGAGQRGYMNNQLRFWNEAASRKSDSRVAFFDEVTKGIRVLRMCAWTELIFGRVKAAREEDLSKRKYHMLVSAFDSIVFFAGSTGNLVITVAFAYYLRGIPVTQVVISQIYMVIMVHRRMLSRYIPQGWVALMELSLISDRIGEYLQGPEVTQVGPDGVIGPPRAFDRIRIPQASFADNNKGMDDGREMSLRVDKVTASWYGSQHDCLSNIHFSVSSGQLLMVVGKVGAGKSTLLQAILGELPVSSGFITFKGAVSYATQEPWIYSGTVRENILFGEPLDRQRYNEVLRVCCLLPDLNTFPDLDKTLVGPRGVTLSGGQKARINLARCLYQRADLYLLDDPLSAVDANVAHQIFHYAIRGFLGDKITVLVTHQVQFLPFASKVLSLKYRDGAGAIGEFGTFAELSDAAKFGITAASEEKQATSKGFDELEQTLLKRIELRDREPKELDSQDKFAELNQISESDRKSRTWDGFSFYLRAAGGPMDYVVFIIVNSGTRLLYIAVPLLLNTWAGFYYIEHINVHPGYFENLDFDQVISISALLWLILLAICLCKSYQFYQMALRAARDIHNNLIRSILWAKMRFFDTTPQGELMSRVSADISYLDTNHYSYIEDLSTFGISAALMIFTTAIFQLEFIASTGFIILVGCVMFNYSIKLTQILKLLDGPRRGATLDHVSVTLDGLATIRAANKQRLFEERFAQCLDRHTSIMFLQSSIRRLSLNGLDWSVVTFCVSMAIFDIMETLNGGGMFAFVGLNFVMQVSRMSQTVFQVSTSFYTEIQALNRIKQFSDLPAEDEQLANELETSKPKQEARFTDGQLEFVGVSLKYTLDGDLVLRDVSFSLRPCEKIGIVGRTGAGKSSLMAILFRLYPFEGFCLIDGQDSKQLELSSLRRSISVIAQDPVLFSGSMRLNLDPASLHSDEELWRALESVQLKQLVQSNPIGLSLQVSEAGSNFSVGQRQLICLARAILRRNKLLVLDEATANVDPETDGLIQRAIRTEFAKCTVLTVAHRLSTIVDSDRVMVMDGGRLREFGSPRELLQSGGLFAKMVADSGSQADALRARILMEEQRDELNEK